MAEQIYTIPINEAFDQYDGCPLCRLKKKLEADSLDYIMGAAMMEPDVRQMTNRQGFCRKHYDDMLAMKNRLSMALTLESRLDTVTALFDTSAGKDKRSRLKKYQGETNAAAVAQTAHSCFVCQRAAGFEEKYVDNTVHMWKKDPAFREKLKKQPLFCLDHYARLVELGQKTLSEDAFLTFQADLNAIMLAYARSIRQDVTAFTQHFDYHAQGQKMTEEQKTAVERAASFLAGA